jgi:asparagine synthase (glutamine-hydrolysing)
MSAALAHRGPDAHGEAVLGPVALDARRLAIIDLEHGNQPIATEDDATVVQNGEIYNHAALRRELEAQGHRFRTRCDTEVIGHLYEEHGLAAFARLRGMFAIALWDARGRRLVLARDRFGIKPLFHARLRDGSLAFASELSALALAPGFSGELDVAALEAYLALNSIPAPMTAYAAARKLPAGHWLTWDSATGRIETARGCRPRPAGELRAEPLDVLAVELRERLRDSVRAHLVADVPVGVLLSGGTDSSALTALASCEGAHPVQTFSIGFRERSFDELDRARLVARRYGTDHHTS